MAVAALTATPTTGSSPAPAAGSALVQLAIWDSLSTVWETDDVTVDRAQRDRGLVVPFLLRIENVSAGELYRIDLVYECGAGEAPGLEFLTDFDRDTGNVPALTTPGPERAFPDAAAEILDDLSIAGDDQHGDRRFRLWGATFAGLPAGPVPQVPCEGEKGVSVSVRALDETVHMLWGAQLAAAEEVSAGPGKFRMKVDVEGTQEPLEISVVVPG